MSLNKNKLSLLMLLLLFYCGCCNKSLWCCLSLFIAFLVYSLRLRTMLISAIDSNLVVISNRHYEIWIKSLNCGLHHLVNERGQLEYCDLLRIMGRLLKLVMNKDIPWFGVSSHKEGNKQLKAWIIFLTALESKTNIMTS